MTRSTISPARLAMAYALDWTAGDPEWFPHPVRAIGAAIKAGERTLRSLGDGKTVEALEGAALTGAVVLGSWGLARAALPTPWRPLVETVMAWTTLATKSLLVEASTVLDALDQGDLDHARRRLARIVGRDTAWLVEPEMVRAVIETVAESACDGIVAPLTWLAFGGVPGALAYKAVNTLDSVIGHPEPPYRDFGRAAARLDDVANFIPARLTALCIVAAAFLLGYDSHSAWYCWWRDGGKHASPNAGQSEAAMAGALGVRLGGLNTYDGHPKHAPLMGVAGRVAVRSDARRALQITATASGLALGGALLYCVWRRRSTGDRDQ